MINVSASLSCVSTSLQQRTKQSLCLIRRAAAPISTYKMCVTHTLTCFLQVITEVTFDNNGAGGHRTFSGIY